MVWMPQMMNKTTMRRKQSKSPTSSDGLPKIKNGILFGAKHKRRILRKRDSTAMTEASSLGSRGWSVGADNALWRVGRSCSLLLGFQICERKLFRMELTVVFFCFSRFIFDSRKHPRKPTNSRRVVGGRWCSRNHRCLS